MKRNRRNLFLVALTAVVFHFGPANAFMDAKPEYALQPKNTVPAATPANKPLNSSPSPARNNNPSWYNDASSFFKKPEELSATNQNTGPVNATRFDDGAPVAQPRMVSTPMLSAPMVASPKISAVTQPAPANLPPLMPVNVAPSVPPTLAAERGTDANGGSSGDWAQSFAEIATKPVDRTYPNLSSVPDSGGNIANNAWSAGKSDLQQQNQQAQQIMQQEWSAPVATSNAPNTTNTGGNNQQAANTMPNAWPLTQVVIADQAARTDAAANKPMTQPIAAMTPQPPAMPAPAANTAWNGLPLVPPMAAMTPPPAAIAVSQPVPMTNAMPQQTLPQQAMAMDNAPVASPAALTGMSWPPVTAEAPNNVPAILNPGPVLVQPLMAPQPDWGYRPPAAPDFSQPMPSLSAPLPAANPFSAPMPNLAAGEPKMPDTLPGDRLRTPGQSPVAFDPVGRAMTQYTNRMQESAPATTGTPYYPYGYSGLGYWYNNPNWATYQRNQNLAAQQAGLPMRRVPQFNKPIATIYFRQEAVQLDTQARQVLQQLAAWYKNQGGGLKIAGHSSARTADMSPMRQSMGNYRVSLERADAVMRELRRLGVDGEKMQLRAFGDNQQAFNESMPSGEAWNRRVEIYWDMF